MTCPSCGAENRPDGKFCFDCGAPLARTCGSCGTPLRGDANFCDECGTPVGVGATATAPAGGSPETPSAERRLVSVLFADLVGFTSLAESRDPEEVRDLLSRYFDASRQMIERYGGIVEKFIGDAVMAVWGTPVAKEDDAERAVRAALDLVDAVSAFGQEVGAPDLRARVGVLTGEAAVRLDPHDEGMVAGDLVNTASRIESLARAGTVLVGESTRRATEAAVVYEDAGEHTMKGKAEPIHLWRATRVVAGVGGAIRSIGLESPFVGRERDIRLLKELFHSSVEGPQAHLLSVVGAAGVGKSRLAWEFFKYIDGLAGRFRWHRGRCLAYGEGVTYWALVEMVRTRAGIIEGEEAGSAHDKLRAACEEAFPDPGERSFVEPRLAHLLGLEERSTHQRDDLFAAWRLFYERLSDEMPTVMVFEDLQWADNALLDFIEHLLEWSRDHRLFVITLARPELTERRPDWGTGRGSTAMYLRPLSTGAMRELLTGMVPGLPDELQEQILDRSEGVPLYAVETVRMLLDRGLLTEEENRYRPAGTIESLEVPETLHALIAARLDGLTHRERQLVQDASVLGKTFKKGALASVSRLPDPELETLLGSLTRKEILSVQADPRSPERGQYGFLQDIVRHVAYETLSKRERKGRHLAAAAYLEESWGTDDEEIIEVVASHFLDAYRSAPEADDAPEIKARARERLARAGERAASLAASEQAQRYFEHAAELADDPVSEARHRERAGQMAWLGGRGGEAATHFLRAMELFEGAGQGHQAARISARQAEIDWVEGRLDEAVSRMSAAFELLSKEEPNEDLAWLAAQLARMHFFQGDFAQATELIELALDLAQRLWLPEVLAQALITKGVGAIERSRLEEAQALLQHALDFAVENDIPSAALRAHFNLGELLCRRDRYEEALQQYRAGLGLARKVGDRFQERQFLAEMCYVQLLVGGWDDEIIEVVEREIPQQPQNLDMMSMLSGLPELFLAQGDIARARQVMDMFAGMDSSSDVQWEALRAAANATMLRAEGKLEEALASARHGWETRRVLGADSQMAKSAFVEAVESSFALGRLDEVAALLAEVDELPPGQRPAYLRAHAARFRSRLASLRGLSGAQNGFKEAAGMFRELAVPFWMAVTLLEHGEWLVENGRADDAKPLLDEAREIFERLQAAPWVERLDRVPVAPAETTAHR